MTRSLDGAVTSWVDLGEGTRAFLATPARFTPPYCALVVGHERSGLIQHTLDLAARFAARGYLAVAPDMASHWAGDKEALANGDASLDLSEDQIRSYMAQGMDYLTALPIVDPRRIAAMGVCQSGGYPHLLNGIRPNLAASIVFYGGTQPGDEVIQSLTAPTLGVFGEADQTVTIREVSAFRAALERHRKTYEINLLPGTSQGWLNDTTSGFREKEADEAWKILLRFLDTVYSGGYPAERVRWRWLPHGSPDPGR